MLARLSSTPLRDVAILRKWEISLLLHFCFRDLYANSIIGKDIYQYPVEVVQYEIQGVLVGCANIYISVVNVFDSQIKIGGFGGVCTHPLLRNRGIATKMCQYALNRLLELNCDVVFLASSIQMIEFYNKLGFVELNKKFSWKNSKGELCFGNGGLIREVEGKKRLFKKIIDTKKPFYVGNGYW